MRTFPRKTITVSATLVSLVVLSLAFTSPPERTFKNLKVLPKNIGEQELDSIMHTYTRGLGVKCEFCHVPTTDRKTDFISDEKPEKNIARKMMRMTNKINKKYFDYERNEQGKV
jgi:Photosynthetic reaction centre cytochrome C subunit